MVRSEDWDKEPGDKASASLTGTNTNLKDSGKAEADRAREKS